MILRVTDSTTTFYLNIGNPPVKGSVYFPKPPSRGEAGAWQPVEEEVTLLLEGSKSNILNTVNALEILFEEARERQRLGVGPRVYVEYAVADADALYRSEIYDGVVEWSRNTKERMLHQATAQVVVTVAWTRAYCWEGPRTQVPLSNVNGSNNTAGLQISNYGDNRHRHVEFDATGAPTIEPAPVELRLKNTIGSVRNVRDVFVFTNKFDVNAALTLQGEARQVAYGTTQASSSASNGQYVNLAINGVLAVPWDLSATLLSQLAGRYCRILAKFFFYDNTANIYVRPLIRDAQNLVTLARGPETKLDNRGPNYIQDLGELPFPPGGYNTNWAGQVLALEFRTESVQTINLDFLLLAPTDAFMHVVQVGNTLDSNEELVIDGIEEQIYCTRSGANHPLYAPKDKFLQIGAAKAWLNNKQRIYVLTDGTDVALADTYTVKLFYRPRRLTV